MTETKGTSGRGQRELRVRVKTAKGRKLSSTLWLERQLNDPYVIRAKKEGYRGRAAYKILELDDKYGFLKPGCRVVDLGCAPGGWTQIAVARVNALGDNPKKPVGTVLGIDLQEVEAIPLWVGTPVVDVVASTVSIAPFYVQPGPGPVETWAYFRSAPELDGFVRVDESEPVWDDLVAEARRLK